MYQQWSEMRIQALNDDFSLIKISFILPVSLYLFQIIIRYGNNFDTYMYGEIVFMPPDVLKF